MYDVQGTVTYDGQPLPTGEISLVPEEKGIAPDGANIENGKFSMKAKAGKKLVVIRASRVMTNPPLGSEVNNPPREDYLPTRYNSKTTLKAEIGTNSKNDLTFELNSK